MNLKEIEESIQRAEKILFDVKVKLEQNKTMKFLAEDVSKLEVDKKTCQTCINCCPPHKTLSGYSKTAVMSCKVESTDSGTVIYPNYDTKNCKYHVEKALRVKTIKELEATKGVVKERDQYRMKSAIFSKPMKIFCGKVIDLTPLQKGDNRLDFGYTYKSGDEGYGLAEWMLTTDPLDPVKFRAKLNDCEVCGEYHTAAAVECKPKISDSEEKDTMMTMYVEKELRELTTRQLVDNWITPKKCSLKTSQIAGLVKKLYLEE